MAIGQLRTLARNRTFRTFGTYSAIVGVIMLPLFAPGYILTLDMVFTPRIELPEHVTNAYPLHVSLYLLNHILPADIVQKLLLCAILLAAAVGMHRLIARLRPASAIVLPWSIYVASSLYIINPFVYARFMAGQYAVLFGYALLPWLLLFALRVWQRPSARQAVKLGLIATLIGIASIHTIGIAAVLALAAMLVALGTPVLRRRLRQIWRFPATAFGVFLLSSSYWLLPLLLGQGSIADAASRFGAQDLASFATTGGNLLMQLAHIASLQGFWAEGRNLFSLPQDILPLWYIAVVLLWATVGLGIATLWRARRHVAIFLLAGMGAAGLLATGALIIPLSEHIPLLAGYREPHKFAGIIALGYCILLASGIDALLYRLRQAPNARALAAAALAILPLLLAPTMFWSFAGQLQARQYPPDWYDMNNRLNAMAGSGDVLFLPWHQYMSYDFAGRIIATPANAFFAKKMIVSDDPELEGASSSTGSTQMTPHIGQLLRQAPHQHALGAQLRQYNVQYVLLAKELDYKQYAYLDAQTDLRLVAESKTLKLYHNQAWR